MLAVVYTFFIEHFVYIWLAAQKTRLSRIERPSNRATKMTVESRVKKIERRSFYSREYVSNNNLNDDDRNQLQLKLHTLNDAVTAMTMQMCDHLQYLTILRNIVPAVR